MTWSCEAHAGRIRELGDPGLPADWLGRLRVEAKRHAVGGGVLFDGERWLLWLAGRAPDVQAMRAGIEAPKGTSCERSLRWQARRLSPQALRWRSAFVEPQELADVLSVLALRDDGEDGAPEAAGSRLIQRVLDLMVANDAF